MTDIIKVPPRDLKKDDVHVDTTGPEARTIWVAQEDARSRTGDLVSCEVRYTDGGIDIREWDPHILSTGYRIAVLRA